ncbi:MAG: zinc metalloprotease HtpX [Candidatus Yanofskybacteria bacterium RIFCSPHIGHO2_02_FULL_44_12b]|uniref:Protease HtpX homolog n=2 Tax=Candidatus Yanofskyibacteriota TaxID=1752733 RepID=A0A1F8GND5_9BACT|nr:MAG: Protease HtpX-like protein [Candidatus Yanofskybacteria bacterium GW2011_GWA2_44_9]OGN05214.1 MAG: zinc metalloprotease HtpX [Candidatus Yanofskybacteria bacterium RIFCSPHIGHO2_01_FULL_44_24]OGN15272.1 MAG: zinc metalloprotease HtpX [Candidatus Yanofskybacteria bacterium RIFCSPHIGHO2_02_FULL_44_12b]OGN26935.1 MAG: zinc metalloprotease HtpX [Candidatus Yanofskybacteria bacterium RIFCSPLOWO2_01_FULL_44_22]
MNLYSHKDSNIRKTWLLITVFLVLIVGIGWFFSYVYNAPEVLYFAVFLSLIMNGVSYWYSDKIALAMSGAKLIANREENLYLSRMVENLCITAGLPAPRIYVIESPQINAFATGRDPKHAAIAVTRGALTKLQNEELEGVLAHELSHVGNRDILISTIVVVLVGLISILADIFMRMSFFGGFRGRDNDSRGGGGALILAIGLVAMIMAPIAATLIQLSVSRKREFLADASGALLTRYPDGLANALEKIKQDPMPLQHAHNATAHLFIANPFKGKEAINWLARLFQTHPPLEERIKILRGMRV